MKRDKVTEALKHAKEQVRQQEIDSTSYHFYLGQVDVLEALLWSWDEPQGPVAPFDRRRRLELALSIIATGPDHVTSQRLHELLGINVCNPRDEAIVAKAVEILSAELWESLSKAYDPVP